METKFLRDALFGGMTSNAFKLGTVLSLGWFWLRIGGCSVLYRGESMDGIDFANILTTDNADAGEIGPPSYIEHNSASTYFYIIRRTNHCGDQEHTLSAAVKVSIDADGELRKPQTNDIFAARAEQVNGSKVQLVWLYCPLEQQSAPVRFKVYYDGGTGQIDYENPVAVVSYAGQRFYHYTTGSLNAGRYLFCIKAEDGTGTANGSLATIRIELDTTSPDAIDILNAEAA
jgi:hypothetical protein